MGEQPVDSPEPAVKSFRKVNSQPFDVPTCEQKLSSLLGQPFGGLFRVR